MTNVPRPALTVTVDWAVRTNYLPLPAGDHDPDTRAERLKIHGLIRGSELAKQNKTKQKQTNKKRIASRPRNTTRPVGLKNVKQDGDARARNKSLRVVRS